MSGKVRLTERTPAAVTARMEPPSVPERCSCLFVRARVPFWGWMEEGERPSCRQAPMRQCHALETNPGAIRMFSILPKVMPHPFVTHGKPAPRGGQPGIITPFSKGSSAARRAIPLAFQVRLDVHVECKHDMIEGQALSRPQCRRTARAIADTQRLDMHAARSSLRSLVQRH